MTQSHIFYMTLVYGSTDVSQMREQLQKRHSALCNSQQSYHLNTTCCCQNSSNNVIGSLHGVYNLEQMQQSAERKIEISIPQSAIKCMFTCDFVWLTF